MIPLDKLLSVTTPVAFRDGRGCKFADGADGFQVIIIFSPEVEVKVARKTQAGASYMSGMGGFLMSLGLVEK